MAARTRLPRPDAPATQASGEPPRIAIAWPSDKVIVTLDAQGRVLLWNAAAEKIFGTPSDKAVGHAFEELVQPDLGARLREAAAQVLRDREPVDLGEVSYRSGLVTRYLDVHLTSIGAGEHAQVLLVGHDVTAERNPHVTAGMAVEAVRAPPRAAEREEPAEEAEPAVQGVPARGHLEFLGDCLVVCNDEAQVLFWSQATAARFGVRPEDALGRRIFDVLPLLDTRGAREAARLALLGITSNVDDLPPTLAEEGLRLTVAPAGDLGEGGRGFLLVAGVEEAPEADLGAAPEQRFEALYREAADPVLLLQPSGTVRAANPAARRTFPLDRARPRLQDLIRPGNPAHDLEGAGLREAVVRDDVRVRTRKGARAWSVVLWPVTSGPAPLRVAMFRDTTEQRRREATVRKSAHALTVYNRILLHDVSNLATAIAGHLELGREKAVVPEVRRHLTAAQGLLSELEALLRNVSILNQAPGKQRREVVDADAALDQALAVTALAFPGRPPPRWRGPRRDVRVLADGTLSQVFYNVISNAVRHNPRPDPSVEVRMRLEREGGATWAVWSVLDNGPGLHPSLREAPPLERVRGRSGLGLSLATTLVRRWGGWLRVEDRVPGKPHLGTAVHIALPVAAGPAAPTGRSRRPRTRRGRSSRARA